jgi:hypothetical protein
LIPLDSRPHFRSPATQMAIHYPPIKTAARTPVIISSAKPITKSSAIKPVPAKAPAKASAKASIFRQIPSTPTITPIPTASKAPTDSTAHKVPAVHQAPTVPMVTSTLSAPSMPAVPILHSTPISPDAAKSVIASPNMASHFAIENTATEKVARKSEIPDQLEPIIGSSAVTQSAIGSTIMTAKPFTISAVIEPVAAVEPDKAVTEAPKAELPPAEILQIELQQPINTPNSAPGSPATDISAMEVASARSTQAAKEVAKVPVDITVLTVPKAPMVTSSPSIITITSISSTSTITSTLLTPMVTIIITIITTIRLTIITAVTSTPMVTVVPTVPASPDVVKPVTASP